MTPTRFALALGLASLAAPALAQDRPADVRAPLSLSVQGGAVWQPEASIDGGGGFSVVRAAIEPSVAWSFGPAAGIGLAVGAGHSAYDFSPGAFIGGLAPWEGVNDLRASLSLRFAVSRSVAVFAAPSVRFDWETGADMTDGLTAGTVIGAAWRVSDSLTIGPGIGIFTGLDEDFEIFPFLLLDWKITETLALRTGSGLGASRGPGLTLEWQASPAWSFGIGARYENIRFRLSDDGPAPGGVGEDRAVPVYLTATWTLSPNASLTAIAGVETFGQLSVENAAGTTVSARDYDPAPFAGFAFTARF